MKIKIVRDTWCKQDVSPATQLEGHFKTFIKAETILEIEKNVSAPMGHRRITLKEKLNGYNTWLFFTPHIQYTGSDLISKAQIESIFGCSCSDEHLKDLNSCLDQFEINTTQRMRHFISQVAHESAGLQLLKEQDSGWYIPARFDLPAIAASDGCYKYRGAGALQLSMPDNYLALSNFLGDPDVYNKGCPYVAEHYSLSSAGFWWTELNRMNGLCDRGATVKEITRWVNGGDNGLSDRERYYKKAMEVI